METNHVNGETQGDIDINDWVIVNSPAGRYLGRVSGDLNKSNLGDGAADLSVEKFTEEGLKKLREQVLEAVSNGDVIKLEPAFDFMAPMRPVQTPDGRVAMTRDPIVTPPDFTLHAIPVYVKAAAIYFCADMKDQDKSTYKDLVRGGLQTALQARAQASGLTLAGGSLPVGKGMPKRG